VRLPGRSIPPGGEAIPISITMDRPRKPPQTLEHTIRHSSFVIRHSCPARLLPKETPPPPPAKILSEAEDKLLDADTFRHLRHPKPARRDGGYSLYT